MSINDAMAAACREVGIIPPADPRRGRWVQCRVDGKAAGNGSGRVIIHEDGKGGVAWNWSTGENRAFRLDEPAGEAAPRRQRDMAAERAAEAERLEVAATCERIVRACRQEPHPYLTRKGFPDERGLVIDDVSPALPAGPLGRRIAAALPEHDGAMLIVPGRIGKAVTTVQFITAEGAKKNILGGRMGGAAHRIATGREPWVCEGIATALTVRAALRLLGRSATVLSAFSAQNVAKVASGIPDAIVAADHDKVVDVFGTGTGEHYARQSGRRWVMPVEIEDFNDLHQREGLRAVALMLREVKP